MNNTVLGTPNTNVILETAGRVYVKVADRYYELKFRDQGSDTGTGTTKVVTEEASSTPEIDLSDYVTYEDFTKKLKKYATKREWQDVVETTEMLQNSLLEGFTESINPITVKTMQVTVGSDNLQFEFVQSRTDSTIIRHNLRIDDDTKNLIAPEGYMKHFTLDGPDAVTPSNSGDYTRYCRWHLSGTAGSNGWKTIDSKLCQVIEFPEEIAYYFYLYVPRYIGNNWHRTESSDPKYCEWDSTTNTPRFLLSPVAISQGGQTVDEYDTSLYSEVSGLTHTTETVDSNYYFFLYAIINTPDNDGSRSIATMNGYTEILPGQITAWIFKSQDGLSFLDLKTDTFQLARSLNSSTGYIILNGCTFTGTSVIGGTYTNGNVFTTLIATNTDFAKATVSLISGTLPSSGSLTCGSSTITYSSWSYDYSYLHFDPGSGLVIRGTIQTAASDGSLISLGGADQVFTFKEAISGATSINGGLILSSVVALGQTSGSTFTIHSGISGIYDTTKPGNGIAAWYGGSMEDKATYYDWNSATTTWTQKSGVTPPSTIANTVFRMDGSGYIGKGQLVVDADGNVFLANCKINSSQSFTELINAINNITNMFIKRGSGTPADPYTIEAQYGLYSLYGVSAYGQGSSGGSGGTSDHTQLSNRDASNQHPISAITNLQTTLNGKVSSTDIDEIRVVSSDPGSYENGVLYITLTS